MLTNIPRLLTAIMTTEPGAPWCLDLFCGAGGGGWGYKSAGFNIFGVDINDQPRYPGWFSRGDALEFLRAYMRYADSYGHVFSMIHASPPCQEYSESRHLRNACAAVKGYQINTVKKMIAPTVDLLEQSGLPWVVENVPGAVSELPSSLMLCGSMFDLGVRRHRFFQSSHLLFAPGPCRHASGFYNVIGGKVRGYGDYASQTTYQTSKGEMRRREGYPGKAVGQKAMDIHWMTVSEMPESFPPVFTRWIGQQMMRVIAQRGVTHD